MIEVRVDMRQIVYNFKAAIPRMMKSQNANLVYLLSFFLPVFVMLGLYISRGIYPFGDSAYLVRDMYHQYAPFYTEFANKLKSGESLTYSHNIGMGVNFTALYAYYLASPVNWLLTILPVKSMIEIMNLIIIGKIGFCGFSFSYYTSKHFGQKDIRSAIFALFYALSSYMAAYSWNIMWLDSLILLPLILLGTERLVQKPGIKSGFLYSISLGIAIFSNYYIGIMLCIYSVLYFIYVLVITNTLHGPAAYVRKLAQFGGLSLMAGGLSACLLLPEYFALQMSGSSDLSFPDTLERYFSIFQMLSRMLMNVPVSTGLTHEPNIYSSVALFLLLPLYFFLPQVSKREKLGKALLIFIFLLSFSLNIPDFIWHGFHFPNSLPARQSFIFIFLLLEMSYEAFRNIRNFTDKQLFGSFAGTITFFLLLDHFLAGEEYSYGIIYLSAVFVTLYLVLFSLYRKHGVTMTGKYIGLLLIFIIAITETIINTSSTGIETVNRTNYTNDNRSIETLVEKVMSEDRDFYRIEKFTRRTKNDAAWSDYPGISIFSSTTNAHLNDYLDQLGLQSSTNAYSFSGQTPLTASLLSVKYMLSNIYLDSTFLTELYAETEGQYLYKNNYTLPLGFMVTTELEEAWDSDSSNPFTVQNNFVKAVLETSEGSQDDIAVEGDLFEPVESNVSGKIGTIPVTTDKPIFIYTNTSDLTSLDITVRSSEDEIVSTKSITDLKHKYIVSLGSTTPGNTIKITTTDEVDSISFNAYSYHNELFEAVYQELKEQPLVLEIYEDTYMKGTITANDAGLMYTSIPYEKGWSAKVDGVETEITAFKEALLAVPLTKGQHTIELFYSPQGLGIGVLISSISLVMYLVLFIYSWKKEKY